MRRFVRVTARLVLVSAAVGTVIKVGRSIMARTPTPPATGAVRTGSFDAWPAVPVAPGRRHPEV